MPRNRRGWGDYYDYGSGPRPVVGGIKAKSERGAIGESWWSKRWVEVLESFELGNRLTRGRSYARKGQVVSLLLEKGQVKAKVQGSQPKPYNVTIKLTPLNPQEWERVIVAMAEQAIFAAKLLAGEMPQNIEEAFAVAGVSLFPQELDDLDTKCSCPDWSNPCKHLAAVYYLLAEQFDEDPFLIFKLRGREKEEIIQALREKRAVVAEVGNPELGSETGISETEAIAESLPLEDRLPTFWLMGESLSEFRLSIEAPPINAALLKRLGTPSFAEKTPDVLTLLAKGYALIAEAALHKANR
ncbi:MAG: SWIM zinc finger family protein [Chloroflexi bacterium]|uniref:SWIM zinc finger family protein n=1 Tax=Candidatus Chlorohelix allophototropha TaxID=3003348 RepID=A0A8T7M683_9CHLR|nr:SWIM zinc finger family protein [Chloroflexota bacterium]WJW69489.1 SWIM zinc finger family protein [Chloroflexota bacterium L227-S17]